ARGPGRPGRGAASRVRPAARDGSPRRGAERVVARAARRDSAAPSPLKRGAWSRGHRGRSVGLQCRRQGARSPGPPVSPRRTRGAGRRARVGHSRDTAGTAALRRAMGLARRPPTECAPAGPAAWLPYHRASIGDAEIAEVLDTLRSGWITTGPKTKRFEREFADRLGVPDALAVSSGTAALHLALRVIGVQPGADVVVPAYTFTATAEAVTYLRARPLRAAVDPVPCSRGGEDVERVHTAATRAVIPVHIAGLPCDMDPILDFARAHGLAVVEDAAHALPARDRGRWVGTLGDAAAFS